MLEESVELAHALEEAGKYGDCRAVRQCQLAAVQAVYGAQHEAYAWILCKLAQAEQGLGHLDAALELAAEALAIRRQRLAVGSLDALAPSPEVAESLHTIAVILADKGAHAEAAAFYEQAIAMWTALDGPEHPALPGSLNGIALALMEQPGGDLDVALAQLQEALRIKMLSCGPEHPDVADSLNVIGNLFYRQDKVDLALEKHEAALKIYIQAYGNDSEEVGSTLNVIGNMLDQQGKVSLAVEKHQAALQIMTQLYGPEYADEVTVDDGSACLQPRRHLLDDIDQCYSGNNRPSSRNNTPVMQKGSIESPMPAYTIGNLSDKYGKVFFATNTPRGLPPISSPPSLLPPSPPPFSPPPAPHAPVADA